MERLGVRTLLAGGCAVAGVAVLAGAGWALLAAGVLLWRMPSPAAARSLATVSVGRVRGVLAGAGRWVTGSGRRAVAIVSAPAAVVLIPVGVGITAGLGLGLVAAGAMAAGVSLLTGWNA